MSVDRMAGRVAALAVVASLAAACSTSLGSADPSPPDGATSVPEVILIPSDSQTTGDAPGASVPPGSTTPPTTTVPLPTVRLELPEAPGGFAQTQGLTGGLGRDEYVITSADDRGPGTYRDALSEGGRYIRFDPSMEGRTIDLRDLVLVDGSDITLDGSAAHVEVTGFATKFSGTNIVVAGMSYIDSRRTDDDDALTFLDASETQVIGLFGNHFAHATDGLVDFIWNRGHDVYVTACGNRFERHDKAMLIHSGRDGREGGIYRVTLCQNLWSDVYQRSPLSRDAEVHQYNSVFERYGKPNGDGGGSKSGEGDRPSEHLLENNVAIPRAEGETTFDGDTVTAPRAEWAGPQFGGDGYLRISGTLLERVGDVTATETEQQPDQVFDPPYDYELAPASREMSDAVDAAAGSCVPAGPDRVVPCAPLTFRDAGDTITAVVDGEATEVWFALGTTRLEATHDGGGRWSITLDGELDTPAVLRVVARTADGREVRSDAVILSVLG